MLKGIVDTGGDVLKDTFLLIPFLFLTYFVMELAERRTGARSLRWVAGAGKAGPVIGALLGLIPQCGFSAAASSLYGAGMISMGTLLAVFLSTSDEMLPLFIAERFPAEKIVVILAAKAGMALISGYLIHFPGQKIFRRRKEAFTLYRAHPTHHGEDKGHGLWKDSLRRTGTTFSMVFLISLASSLLIDRVGAEAVHSLFGAAPLASEMIAGLIGLVPNCGASILISQLYIGGLIGPGPMMSGLLASAGVGLLVLFRENRNIGENLLILATLYGVSVLWGMGIAFVL